MSKALETLTIALLPKIIDMAADLMAAKNGDKKAAERAKRKLAAEVIRQGNAIKEKALFG